jgi:hypothetical protein
MGSIDTNLRLISRDDTVQAAAVEAFIRPGGHLPLV